MHTSATGRARRSTGISFIYSLQCYAFQVGQETSSQHLHNIHLSAHKHIILPQTIPPHICNVQILLILYTYTAARAEIIIMDIKPLQLMVGKELWLHPTMHSSCQFKLLCMHTIHSFLAVQCSAVQLYHITATKKKNLAEQTFSNTIEV